MSHNLEFNPNPLQKQFIEARSEADLFSSRRGEGKSTALSWACLYHTRHNPGADWVLIRDTFENIVATTQKTFFQWFPPGICGNYNASKKTFTWAEGLAKGSVTFLGMDDPADASKLQSREFGGCGMDEVAPIIGNVGINEMVFDVALSSLRQKGMKWYACKLAENNPDEAHWSFKRFVIPGTAGFKYYQPPNPENMHNLPRDYYAKLRKLWAHRPDMVRRLIDGEFGFLQVGRAVTPQWSDKLHLAVGLEPVPRIQVEALWDFGHNPTCLLTQRTPLGNWNILDACVGDGIGTEELLENLVIPLWNERYAGLACSLRNIGDPNGGAKDQSSTRRSAVRSIRIGLGGIWRAGPVKPFERIDPLQAVLTRTLGGRGLVQVDRDRCPEVWQALRGGWHYHVSRTGISSTIPVKDQHSHPGDAMGYGAAIIFPLGRKAPRPNAVGSVAKASPGGYFSRGTPRPEAGLARIGTPVASGRFGGPKHGDRG